MPNSLLFTIILGLLLGLCYYLLRQQRYVLFYLAGCMAFGLIFGAALPDAHRLKKDGVPVQARISRLDCQNRGSVDYVYDAGSGIYGGSTTGAKIGRLCDDLRVGMTIPAVYLPQAPGKSIAASASKHFNEELRSALMFALTMPAGLILIQRRKFADSASAQRR